MRWQYWVERSVRTSLFERVSGINGAMNKSAPTQDFSYFSDLVFIATVILIATVSIYNNSLKTVNIAIILPLLVYFSTFLKKKIDTHIQRESVVLTSILIAALAICQTKIHLGNFDHSAYTGIFGDHIFYNDLLLSLKLFKVENTFLANNLLIPNPPLSPYHYWDIWLLYLIDAAGVGKVYGYSIVLPSLLLIISAYCLVDLSEKIKITRTKVCFTTLIAAIGIHFYPSTELIPIKPDFMSSMGFLNISLFDYPKTLISFIIISWGALIYSDKIKFRVYFMVSAMLTISNIAYLPAILMTTVVVIFYETYKRRFSSYLVLSLLVAIAVCVYYFLPPKSNPRLIEAYGFPIISMAALKTKIRLFAGEAIAVIIYYWIWLVPFFLPVFRRKFFGIIEPIRGYLGGLLIMVFSAWAFSVLISEMPNAYQFFGNVLNPLAKLVIFLIICALINFYERKSVIPVLTACVICSTAIYLSISQYWRDRSTESDYWKNSISADYQKKVSQALKSVSNPIGGSIIDPERVNHFERNGLFLFNNLDFHQHNFDKTGLTLNLNAPIIGDRLQTLNNYQLALLYDTPFGRLVRDKHITSGAPEVYDWFLKTYNIKYIFLENSELIRYLPSDVIKEAIVDNISGQTFVLLNSDN